MSIQQAIEVLQLEAEGILGLAERIDASFSQAVDLIYQSTGRVIVGGIGKSGIVGRKIVATLNSTGTQALFLHPVEAVHGDLGIVCKDDVFLALSNSGETEELNILLPSIHRIGCKIIAFTGNIKSPLARNSDIIIDVGVDREACPLGLTPTTSTTALLAMGDALAVVLIHKRGFKSSDFKRYHPGGALGHRLTSQVAEFMLTGDGVPLVDEGASMADALKEINRVQIGATLVVTRGDTLSGIITDGDIRRALALDQPILDLPVDTVMTRSPVTLGPDSPTYDALNLMERSQITVLPITNPVGRVRGILHLHDILGKGEFKFNGT